MARATTSGRPRWPIHFAMSGRGARHAGVAPRAGVPGLDHKEHEKHQKHNLAKVSDL